MSSRVSPDPKESIHPVPGKDKFTFFHVFKLVKVRHGFRKTVFTARYKRELNRLNNTTQTSILHARTKLGVACS